ncbi:histidine kinase [Streptomyces spectabilis]|uniref:Circadian input-output histidine kinase CikA n=2 Tax=Streptomyces spectabilis TaxID=68270 RepID=A0A7W8ART9_STRST|nr:signal transduction histidine kinase/HAMP domain-containing protein/CheY-like chemotaxis protein [Streptomyces spectabilis]GGV49260.1 histidine kinase [Streptomyces spectabilis]
MSAASATRRSPTARAKLPAPADAPGVEALSAVAAPAALSEDEVAGLRALLAAMRAARDGNFTKAPLTGTGLAAELITVFNELVDRSTHFDGELIRIRREMVRHGRLDERFTASPGQGSWATRIIEVNSLLDSLVAPATNATRVLNAVAGGDLTQRVDLHDGSRELRGDLRRLGRAVNTMVDQLSLFTGEVTRVAREVGTEGRLGGRAKVRGLSGSWRDVTEAVNTMASRLTAQVRDIALVTTAVAQGDLTRTVTVEATGELLELKLTVNTMVEQLSAFAAEVTRVAREVGTEGRLGGRAQARGVSGVWKDLTDNVNFMASNLTSQVRNIAQVTTAVANGDLSQKITVDARGEILELKDTVNTMVDQLSAFADEVTRVAREVGTEGNLGGRAHVRGVSGVWKDLTDNVNFMADNLTSQVRNIALVSTAVAQGDLSKKITVEAKGEILELKSTINTMVDQLSAFADEVTRVAREVGTEGNLGGQAQVRGVSGVWEELTDNVNFMASNLTSQVRNIAQVTTAVANGDLSKMITVTARGEILELKDTVNTMVEQLRAFADEVTRVAREVGTDGRLGGRAQVLGVSGVWKDLTDNVNYMADNLTGQVRNIAQVATAVAQGDLSKKIDVDARGEILELKTTINTMVDTLSSFSSEVTRVAREVGSEGQLGGQARVEGVYGTWKRLTTNVNELALNLTTQVRAIAEVASAVAQGDMSRSITVETRGEVAELKDNINLMVSNLRETTRAKDWLESNLARLAGLMQGHRDLMEVADLILRELTPLVNAQYGAFFLANPDADGSAPLQTSPAKGLAFIAGYGSAQDTGMEEEQGFLVDTAGMPAHGLVRQAALEKKRILLDEVPPDYIKIHSGLGDASPASVVIIPILFEDKLLGVIELATFSRFSDVHLAFFDQFVNTIGVAINTIIANSRTESLLSESQRLATQLQERSDELQRQQAELRRSNAELEEKAALLATSSQYKSEFLANMSHELRTPLNSLLILARLLSDNPDGHLSDQEVQFASTIHRSGSDLLQLINDILDLSKIEAGRMDVRPKKLPLIKVLDYVHATFRPLTLDRGLAFDVTVGHDVPREMFSDEQRLQQILRNLLSNAVKFTANGRVELSVQHVKVSPDPLLSDRGDLISFTVRDTGIGIPPEQLPVIFEAFQQVDGTTNRKYGGTGLGLSISREIAGLLGGRITAESRPGEGSTFTLYVPVVHPGHGAAAVAYASSRTVPTPEPREQMVLSAHTVPEADDNWPAPTKLEEWKEGHAGRVLPGRRVLIVDDDIRNVFALTHVLSRVGLVVLYAENGREGIETLERNPDTDLILMDIMMPEMDGYETIAAIRRSPRWTGLPIVALTAKAMPGDREKAISQGATDYVPKPVDVDQLLTVVCALLDPEGEPSESKASTSPETVRPVETVGPPEATEPLEAVEAAPAEPADAEPRGTQAENAIPPTTE